MGGGTVSFRRNQSYTISHAVPAARQGRKDKSAPPETEPVRRPDSVRQKWWADKP